MFSDPEVVAAARSFVKVIIRRPQAYAFRQRYPSAPIPGIAFLNADGELKGRFVIPEKDAAMMLVAAMKQGK